jgi:hypothetical protein
MALFQPGQPKTGGRAKGVRNRLSHTFLEALQKDFAEHGEEAIRICRIERPSEYVKIVAGLMPKELDITNNTLTEIDDTQLVEFIEYVRLQLEGRIERIADRADSEADGESSRLLQTLPPPTRIS